ncbi:MAG: cation:proton antiporter, partial [Dehalococcoidia bacterium]
AILVPLGSWLLPPLFASLRTLQQREVFVLAAAALALLTAYVASLFGLSPALGAFVAGIVLSESEIRHEVLNGIVPMRDIFAGLFFVSIGMLLDPMFVASNPVPVLATLALMVPIKGLITAGLAMPLGVTVRRSILAGGGLAQSAEFSFVLASLGASLAALSDNEFSVMLSATALSVVLAPAVHVFSQRLSRRVEVATHQDLTRGWEPAFQDHVIICGYGRVGSVVVRVLRERNVPVAVIDLDVSAIITLRDQGVPAFLGTADNPLLLTRAGIDRAALLVVAVPEPTAVRRLVQLAREANPTIEIVARTHEIAERDRLEAGGVQEAVVGELELAIEMARYALRVTGMDPLQADEHVARIRHGLIE